MDAECAQWQIKDNAKKENNMIFRSKLSCHFVKRDKLPA
jgi:hypothetical protein